VEKMGYLTLYIINWGLGIGDWGLGSIYNSQSTIPNIQQHPIIKHINKYILILKIIQ